MTPNCSAQFQITFPDTDLRLYEEILFILRQGPTIIEKTEEDLTVAGNVITVELTPDDTAGFIEGVAEMQFIFTSYAGDNVPSNIATVDVDRNLHEAVIT